MAYITYMCIYIYLCFTINWKFVSSKNIHIKMFTFSIINEYNIALGGMKNKLKCKM